MNHLLMALSAPDFDLAGAGVVRLRPDSLSEILSGERRQMKTATLDGGVTLYDTGYTLTDKIWRVRLEYSKAGTDLIEYLSKNYQMVYVSVVGLLAIASIKSWRVDGQDISISISILEVL